MNDTTQALEAVVGMVGKATPGDFTVKYGVNLMAGDGLSATHLSSSPNDATERNQANAVALVAATNFLRTHGPALIAALEDARRYRWLRRHAQRIEWVDAGATETFEWETEAETTEDDDLTLDAAIDAAQEVGK